MVAISAVMLRYADLTSPVSCSALSLNRVISVTRSSNRLNVCDVRFSSSLTKSNPPIQVSYPTSACSRALKPTFGFGTAPVSGRPLTRIIFRIPSIPKCGPLNPSRYSLGKLTSISRRFRSAFIPKIFPAIPLWSCAAFPFSQRSRGYAILA